MLEGIHPCDISILQHEKERYGMKYYLFSYVSLSDARKYYLRMFSHGEARKRSVVLAKYLNAYASFLIQGPKYFADILSIADIATRLTSWQKVHLNLNIFEHVIPFRVNIFSLWQWVSIKLQRLL